MPVKGPQNVSLKAALKHLTAALLNPNAGNVCAISMGFAALRIEQELERYPPHRPRPIPRRTRLRKCKRGQVAVASRPEDLFPNGLEQSFPGLEGWCLDPHGVLAQGHWEGYVPVEYSIYQLIGQLVAYHEPFAASLLDVTKLPIVIVGPIGYLETAGLLHKAGNLRAFERVLGIVFDFYDSLEEYDFVQFEELMGERGYRCFARTGGWRSTSPFYAAEWKRMHRRVFRWR
ncbi:hypothetical protein FA13DRAFT_1820976 [Coprinellus micaceus]|uniref:Uncharacterized protein n=1 Tax=Coprinellus micaceus TaxID=71717 RepID=A0A4Y7SDJ4_COPMI|nr:hypothetical protein FA13DRAFT_1820976 [Coprinellus micaceus]